MAGFKTKGEIHDFWVVNRDKLDVIFPGIGYEVPSTSTITRANHLIAAEILEDEFIRLFGEEYNLVRRMNGSYDAVDLLKRDVIACDGQAIRSTTRLQENGKKSTPFEIAKMKHREKSGTTFLYVSFLHKNAFLCKCLLDSASSTSSSIF